MNNTTTFQQPFELVTQKFLSKIKYGELTVKFPSGSIKNMIAFLRHGKIRRMIIENLRIDILLA